MAEKKKNIFKRIAQKFRDVRLEMKKAVWPSKEKLKQTSAVVLVVIVFFAILENMLAFRYKDMYNYERKL